jgi:hypothetical protein
MHQHSDLIKQLLNCAIICEMCKTACLSEKEVTMMKGCIALDIDCADICILTARLLQRNSPVGHHLLTSCEEICRLCAEECKKHNHIQHCKECADACQKCADACKEHLIAA